MAKKYTFQSYGKNMARAMGKDLGISTRQSIEVARFIKGMEVQNALSKLNAVQTLKQAIPYRVRASAAHRPGIGPGKFPVKCTKAFIDLLEQAKANAQFKGLGSSLEIVHVNANLAARPFRNGRKGRVQAKRTNLEIVVAESEKPVAKKSDAQLKKQSAKVSAEKAQGEKHD